MSGAIGNRWADRMATRFEDPCTSRAGKLKRRYPTRALAWCACATYRLLPGGCAIMFPYHCPKCGWFHTATARYERKPWARGVIKRIHEGGQP